MPSPPDTGSITAILNRIEIGDTAAREELFDVIYGQLKQLARKKLRGQADRDMLQTTLVVNEACMRLTRDGFKVSPKNRRQLFVAANRAIQWVLVDYARKRTAGKRTPDEQEVVSEAVRRHEEAAGVPYSDLHDALQALRADHARVATVVEGKFFGRMTNAELAEILDLSVDTVKRDWRFGRAFLHSKLSVE